MKGYILRGNLPAHLPSPLPPSIRRSELVSQVFGYSLLTGIRLFPRCRLCIKPRAACFGAPAKQIGGFPYKYVNYFHRKISSAMYVFGESSFISGTDNRASKDEL